MQLIEIGDTRVVQIRPDDSIDYAIALLEEHGFRHLPVVERGRILGMVSDRDLLSAVGMLPSESRTAGSEGPARVGATKIAQVMSSPARTIPADAPLAEAAELMLNARIRALPLLYKDHLAGIVTETDFLKCYLDDRPIAHRPGWRLQKVGDRMSAPVISLLPGDTFLHAVRVMQTRGIRHLPIVKDDRLLGIVSDRDMRKVLVDLRIAAEDASVDGPIHQPEVILRDIMTRDVVTAEPALTLAEIAGTLVTGKFGCLPVLEEPNLVGIITQADLLQIFVEACKA
ncbi:MAG: CBS domain-containing protein [Phycisphaerae bacterium]